MQRKDPEIFTCYNSHWKPWKYHYCHQSIKQGCQHLLLQSHLTTIICTFTKPQSHQMSNIMTHLTNGNIGMMTAFCWYLNWMIKKSIINYWIWLNTNYRCVTKECLTFDSNEKWRGNKYNWCSSNCSHRDVPNIMNWKLLMQVCNYCKCVHKLLLWAISSCDDIVQARHICISVYERYIT